MTIALRMILILYWQQKICDLIFQYTNTTPSQIFYNSCVIDVCTSNNVTDPLTIQRAFINVNVSRIKNNSIGYFVNCVPQISCSQTDCSITCTTQSSVIYQNKDVTVAVIVGSVVGTTAVIASTSFFLFYFIKRGTLPNFFSGLKKSTIFKKTSGAKTISTTIPIDE